MYIFKMSCLHLWQPISFLLSCQPSKTTFCQQLQKHTDTDTHSYKQKSVCPTHVLMWAIISLTMPHIRSYHPTWFLNPLCEQREYYHNILQLNVASVNLQYCFENKNEMHAKLDGIFLGGQAWFLNFMQQQPVPRCSATNNGGAKDIYLGMTQP